MAPTPPTRPPIWPGIEPPPPPCPPPLMPSGSPRLLARPGTHPGSRVPGLHPRAPPLRLRLRGARRLQQRLVGDLHRVQSAQPAVRAPGGVRGRATRSAVSGALGGGEAARLGVPRLRRARAIERHACGVVLHRERARHGLARRALVQVERRRRRRVAPSSAERVSCWKRQRHCSARRYVPLNGAEAAKTSVINPQLLPNSCTIAHRSASSTGVHGFATPAAARVCGVTFFFPRRLRAPNPFWISCPPCPPPARRA